MDQNLNAPEISYDAPVEAPKKSNKTLIIVLIVVAVLLLCCCCAVVTLVVLSTLGVLSIPFMDMNTYGYVLLMLPH